MENATKAGISKNIFQALSVGLKVFFIENAFFFFDLKLFEISYVVCGISSILHQTFLKESAHTPIFGRCKNTMKSGYCPF